MEGEIIAKLQQVEGCRFASLVQITHQPDECISLTLWDSEEAVEGYATRKCGGRRGSHNKCTTE